MKLTAAPIASFESVSRRYRFYVLALLTLVFIVNFIDRQVLSVLIEPIKRDLRLTDTQLGLLSGLAFALFYVTAGVPMARLADLKSRRNLVTACMIVWSSMTALCGLAANFVQLLMARIGVAVGEAGCVAPSHSILSDYYRPSDRPTALSIYAAGASVGVFLELLGGGWLAEEYGWRVALVILGLPGIAVALVVLMTLREPARGMSVPVHDASASPPPTRFWSDLARLLRRRTLVSIALAVLTPYTTASLMLLTPAAFLSMVYVGPALAATHGVAGVSLRATGVALTLFVSNLLGIGGGALLVGVVSDAFVAAEPTVSLRYGLLAVLLANIPATIGYLLAAINVREDWNE